MPPTSNITLLQHIIFFINSLQSSFNSNPPPKLTMIINKFNKYPFSFLLEQASIKPNSNLYSFQLLNIYGVSQK